MMVGDIVLWESSKAVPSLADHESYVGIVLKLIDEDGGFEALARVDFWSNGAQDWQNDPEFIAQKNLVVIGNVTDWNRGVFRLQDR